MMIEVDLEIRPDETLDCFYQGRVLVLQRKNGFRFSVEAPLLADFITTTETDELIEVGTGCGIIPLLLSIKPFKHIVALEIQPGLAELTKRNVLLNNLEGRITILQKDFRDYSPFRKFDVVFSNPPYIPKNSGHLSPSKEKNIAKHELFCSIEDLLVWTKKWLKETGRAFFIFPDCRREEFELELQKQELKIRTIRLVHPRENEPASFFLTECAFNVEAFQAIPPLILFGQDGKYTKEAEEIFAGRNPGNK
jgi:tRNA1(Val) A37 N6-methylase TrmN6